MSAHRLIRLVGVLAVAAGLAASPAVAGAGVAKHHHHAKHHLKGNDHDADNHGGPSDGDGNM